MGIEYEVNNVLFTKDSKAVTNAIVVEVTEDEVTVLSDFGNLMTFPKDSLAHYYDRRIDEPFSEYDAPEMDWKERLEGQIEKLKKVLEGF